MKYILFGISALLLIGSYVAAISAAQGIKHRLDRIDSRLEAVTRTQAIVIRGCAK